MNVESGYCGRTEFYLEVWEGGDPGPDLLRGGSEHAEDSEELVNLGVALEKSKETIVQLTNSRHSYEEQLASLNQEIEKSETRSSKHSRVEEVLQRQISELQAKLESANQGK